MSATSRDTTWIGHEFDRRAATYDESEMHRWQAEQAVTMFTPSSFWRQPERSHADAWIQACRSAARVSRIHGGLPD